MEYVRISRTGINKTWKEMQFPNLAWAQGIIQPHQQQQQLQLLSPCGDADCPNLGVRGVSWHCIQCTLSRVLCVTCTPSTKNTPGSSAAAHPAPEMCAYWSADAQQTPWKCRGGCDPQWAVHAPGSPAAEVACWLAARKPCFYSLY